MEAQALRPYLYMQHYFNKFEGHAYKFFNPEMGQEDFELMNPKNDLPRDVHFEIIGSKAILGEDQRSAQTAEVTKFLFSNEKTAGLPNAIEIAKQLLMDAGNKRPELLLNIRSDEDQEIVDARVTALAEELQNTVDAAEETQDQLEQKLDELTQQMQVVTQNLNESKLDLKKSEVRETEERVKVENLRKQIVNLKDMIQLKDIEMNILRQTVGSVESIRNAKNDSNQTNGANQAATN